MFILDPHSGVPIYRQLLEQIRRLTASGQLPPGSALPSIREIAVRHAINPMTVSKVYTLLEAEGLLERNRGKPMTVAARPRAPAPAPKRLEQLAPHLDQLVLAARQLEISEAEIVKALRARWENGSE
jgi:GntR family transcriptional regulator